MDDSLSSYTTLRLGGPVEQLLVHAHRADWPDLVRAAQSRQPFTLGGGSNIIAADSLIPGTVIRMATRGITARRVPGDPLLVDVVCAAGEPLEQVVEFALAEGLSGLEYLAGTPGTVGAAPVQNTGAYGQEIAHTLHRVTAYHWPTARVVHMHNHQCELRHRTSRFKQEPHQWTILEVVLRLYRIGTAAPLNYHLLADKLGAPLGSCPPLEEAVAAVREDRHSRGLNPTPTGPDARQAGSVFINPVVTREQAQQARLKGAAVRPAASGRWRLSAGWLLEQVGHHPADFLGHGVFCSSQRTLTLIATEHTTSSGFTTVLERLRREVENAFAIRLEIEPVHLTQARAGAGPTPVVVAQDSGPHHQVIG